LIDAVGLRDTSPRGVRRIKNRSSSKPQFREQVVDNSRRNNRET